MTKIVLQIALTNGEELINYQRIMLQGLQMHIEHIKPKKKEID